MADPKTPAAAKPKAPGPDVVEALANPGAALFMKDVLDEARDALKASWHRRDDRPDDVSELTPTQKGSLRLLEALGAQLVTATTVPSGGAS